MNSIQRSLRIFYLLIAIPIFSSYCQDFNSLSYGYSQKAKVARVIDGDTFVLSDSQRVRILGIDCPEIAKPGKPAQPFGEEVKQKTKSLIEGKTIKLTFEKEAGYHDFFGRLLAHVWLVGSNNKDSLFLQAELLKAGLARVRFYSKQKRYYGIFKNLERTAKKNKVGMWNVE
ncbi:MAG: thermonuclease family protein [Ignavibacteriaceae bacterium]|nr:thermonuclease family protein [Ignavibacteriaceae bacterium]